MRSFCNPESIFIIYRNNAGLFKAPNPRTEYGFNLRIIVNTRQPYILTKRLLPVMTGSSIFRLQRNIFVSLPEPYIFF